MCTVAAMAAPAAFSSAAGSPGPPGLGLRHRIALSIALMLGRRLGRFLVVIAGVTVIVFVAVRLSGDPTALLIPQGATADEAETLRHSLGLDRPIYVQFGLFVERAAQGDFGTSFSLNRPAMDAVMQALPVTLELTATALVFLLVLALPLGIAAAVFHGTWVDSAARMVATATQAAPSFWIGLVLILVFAVELNWLPPSGWGTFEQALLPGLTLALFSFGRISRLMRGGMLDAMTQAWTLTARAKGLTRRRTVFVHQLRNALLPVVSLIGVELGVLVGGAVITETVFGIPGMGRLAVNAVLASDYPLVQATVFVAALLVTAANLLADGIMLAIDPRLRAR